MFETKIISKLHTNERICYLTRLHPLRRQWEERKKMMNLRTMINGLSANAVARELIQYWEHDERTLTFLRASSNFVYFFKKGEQKYYLRFSFEQDNSKEQILAEVDYLQYLAEHGYPCVTAIPSDKGNTVETIKTVDGLYFGVVFTPANGSPLDLNTMSMEHFVEWGKSLAALHSLSKTYIPLDNLKRKHWKDILDSVDNTLQKHPSEKDAKIELDQIRSWLNSLTFSKDSFGLIHYDFQLDNVYWDETEHHFNVFDFDDSMYHWFAMDVVTTLKDLFEMIDEESKNNIESFLRGYRTILPLNDDATAMFPKFKRFDHLYTFSKLLLTLENSDLDDVPPWYEGLKGKLIRVRDEIRQEFKRPW